MRIDRNRFLLLTASLSAGACASGAPSAVPAEPVVAEAPAEPASDESAGDEPATTTAGDADAGTPVSPVTEGGSPVSEWSPPPSPPTTLNTGKCNDNVGKPGACTFKAPGPQCESFASIASECKSLVKGVKPKVAERAVDCMKQKSGTPDICDFALPSRCLSEAIRNGVCPEKTSEAECQQPVSLCSGRLSMNECRAGYSAVQTKNRKRMLSCMTEFCSIDNCLYQL